MWFRYFCSQKGLPSAPSQDRGLREVSMEDLGQSYSLQSAEDPGLSEAGCTQELLTRCAHPSRAAQTTGYPALRFTV